MEAFILSSGNIIKVYSTKELLLKGWIEACKTYYKDNYEKETRRSINALTRLKEEFPMSEENRADLIDFLQEKEYKGIFTLKELENTDMMFKFDIVKIDE